FKFITDKDISGNDYYVGAPWQPLRSGFQTSDDRKDSVYRKVTFGTWQKYGGNLPNNIVDLGTLGTYPIIDDASEIGNQRYEETDTFQLEDYPSVRNKIELDGMDWNNTKDKT